MVNMETIIVRGDTVEESTVDHVTHPGIEEDETLLYGWNKDLGIGVEPLSKLDEYHLLWYKFNQVGNILCMFEHFNLDEFDQRVLVSILTVTVSLEVITSIS